jgi:hypothetical protein
MRPRELKIGPHHTPPTLDDGKEHSENTFVLVNALCSVGAVIAFIFAVFFIRFKRIM